jgi:AcrR family transcriptional regulator
MLGGGLVAQTAGALVEAGQGVAWMHGEHGDLPVGYTVSVRRKLDVRRKLVKPVAKPVRTRAARKPLTRERVLRTALRLADKGGIESLSMRKLAQELGVEAMSLYNHVKNKDDIIGGLVDLVAQEMEPAPDDVDWKTALRRTSISAHDAHNRHPWAAAIWMRSGGASPVRFAYADAMLRALRRADLSDDLIYHGYHSLTVHVMGFTLQERNFQFDEAELRELAGKFLETFPSDEYPELAEHIRQHMEPSEGSHGTFEFGLDLILDGLERLRDAG